MDIRNYGGLEGIRELREMFAELLSVETEQLVAGGNSSLVMMREVLVDLWLKGGVDSERPWGAEEKVTFICPVPGYDRHFTLLEWFGIETVTVPMHDDGPDVEAVAELAASDPSIKGIWIVPTYANPTGSVVSPGGRRAAGLDGDRRAGLQDLLGQRLRLPPPHRGRGARAPTSCRLASAAGHPHRPILFASTSKITYAGAGVAFLAGSVETVKWYVGHLGKGAIGPDKLNQLRHAQFFGSPQGVRDHMVQAPRDHRAEVRGGAAGPDRAPRRTRAWPRGPSPTGGYFVSLDVLDGTASRVIELAKEAGIALTPAGASFPGRARPARPQHPPGPHVPRPAPRSAPRWRRSPPACCSPPPRR